MPFIAWLSCKDTGVVSFVTRSGAVLRRLAGKVRNCVSSDTKAIIGTIIGTGLAVAVLLSAQIAAVNGRVDDVRADMRDMQGSLRSEIRDLRTEMRATMDRFDARLDAVEVALGKVDQRLLTIERVVLPAAPPNE